MFIIVNRTTFMDGNLYDSLETIIFLEILYRATRVYLWFAFASDRIVVLIGRMNNRMNATQRLEEDISNAGAPPVVIKFLHLKKMLIWNKLRSVIHP